MISLDKISLDLNSKCLWIESRQVSITKSEFFLIRLLLENPEKILSRKEVLSAMNLDWGPGSDHILNLHCSRLRLKLRNANAGEYFFSTAGFGLSIKDPKNFKKR